MPELAEVELIRRDLDVLAGDRLTGLDVCEPLLHRASPELESAPPLDVSATRRHGKLVALDCADILLVFHLRMTGALLFTSDTPKHTRAVLEFASGLRLVFTDPRKFGTVTLEAPAAFAAELGPDILNADDDALAAAAARAARSARAVKDVLLDQHVVAGVGNYMADETLWRAAEHPHTPAHELGVRRWRLLFDFAGDVAVESLRRGGVTLRDYRRPDGSRGDMQNHLACYGRAGLPCLRCEEPLAATRVAGRGTSFCPNCQPPLVR